MTDFLTALALVLVIEGVLYAAFPNAMRRAVEAVLEMDERHIRTTGLVVAVLGLGGVWLIRG
jgi:uncharacterized protein YjeT (DUF2065 family)